jgi:hypothetical protein
MDVHEKQTSEPVQRTTAAMVPASFAWEPSGDRLVLQRMDTRHARRSFSSLEHTPQTPAIPRATRRSARPPLLIAIAAALAPACAAPTSFAAGSSRAAPDAAVGQAQAAAAPSFDELFDTYFDKGKPGHCATAGCHADPSHNVWLCMTKDTCYEGMLDVGLIDPADPTHSEIADPKRSPLTWINPAGGNMPLDAQGENDAARAAIESWVAAGAPKD